MKIKQGSEKHVSSYVKDVNEVPLSLKTSKPSNWPLSL